MTPTSDDAALTRSFKKVGKGGITGFEILRNFTCQMIAIKRKSLLWEASIYMF
jgi:hypothetical protein